jgi:hypothetical protein
MTDTEQVLMWCLRYFAHYDESNAAVHTALVQYSPITFRIAECLEHLRDTEIEVDEILLDAGRYTEDRGR